MGLIRKLFKRIVEVQDVVDGQINLGVVIVNYLGILQTWTTHGGRTFIDYLRFFISWLACNLAYIPIVGSLIHYCVVTENPTFLGMGIDVAITVSLISGDLIILTFFVAQPRARFLLEAMGDFREYEKPNRIEVIDALINAGYKIIYFTLGISIPLLVSLLLMQSCEDNDATCGLALPAYVPGMTTAIHRKIFMVYQVSFSIIGLMLGFGAVLFFLQVSEYFIVYLQHLQTMFAKIKNISDWTERYNYAIKTIKYQQRILWCHEEFAKIARNIFVCFAVSMPVIVSILIFSLMMEFNVIYLALLMLWIADLFCACYVGQQMINESEKLSLLVYEAVPLDGDLIVAKLLQLVIMRSQRPLVIPVGNLTYCSYELFLKVIQTIYSYLALLHSTSSIQAN